MKLRNLFMAVIVGVTMLAGCNKEVDLGPAQLTVSDTELVFTEADGSQILTILATRDWVVSGIPEENWLGIQESGKADPKEQQVLITVAQNTGTDRSANLVFTIGYARVNVKITQQGPEGAVQTGDGTFNNPFTVAGVIAYIDQMQTAQSPKVFVKGKVSDVTSEKMEQFSTEYGNGTFMISEDGSLVGPQFEAFRILYLGNKKFAAGDTPVKAGDDVVIYGKVYKYKETYETVDKEAFLYSLNGEDRGGVDIAPPADEIENSTVAAFIEAASADTYYRLTGKVSEFQKGTNSKTGKNWLQFNLTDETGTVLVYGFKDGQYEEWADKIKDGGTAVVTGTYEYYSQKQQHEVMNATVESFTEGEVQPPVDEDPSGTGTANDPYNPKAAYDAASALEPNGLSEDVYIAGIISSIKYTFSAQYGTATFNISEDGTTSGTQFTCYAVKYLDNRDWVEGDTQIQVGDQVVVCGKLTNFQADGSTTTTPETASKQAYLVSLISGGTPGPQPGEADGLTPETAFTAEQAYDWVVANLAAGADTGEQKYYVKGKVTKFYQRSGTDQNFANNSYHQASFYMNDVEGKDFEAYQINYLGGATWAEGDTDVAVGDDVVIYGPLKHYVASSGAVIAETTSQGTAYLYSLNGKTAGGDTPEPVEPGDVDFDKATAIKLDATQTWAAATDNTYGAGFGATDASGIQVAIGKYESTTTLVQPDQYGTKVYKKAVITLTAPTGRKIIGVRFKASDYSNGQYCKPLTVLEPAGGGTLAADATTFMIGDWTGEATKVAFQALEAQARLLEAYVVLDGEGGGDTPGPEPGTGNDGLTPETAFTVAEAIAKAQEVGIVGTSEEYYVRGFVYRSVDFTHDATFEMMGSSIQELFTIFRTKSFGGADWTGQEPIGWGDDVIVKGKIATMYGATPVLSNGTLISWNDKTSWDGEEPQPEPDYETNLSNINSAADNTAVKFIGTVMGVSTNSFVVSDGSTNVYVFKPASMAAIGDVVKVEGTKTTYNGVPEIAQGATVTIDGSVRDLVYPNPFDITSTFDNYTSGSINYITFTGTLAKSGNYYNVNVDGATAHVGSISSPIEGLGLNDMNGKIVTFTGYYVGFSGKKYVNMLCVSAQEAGQQPGGDIQTVSIAEFINRADGNTYRLSGTTSNVYSYLGQNDEQVLQFELTDNTGTITVSGFAEGEVAKWYKKVPEGATVTLTGKYGFIESPNGNIALITNAVIESCEGGTDPGQGGGDFPKEITFDFTSMNLVNGTQYPSFNDDDQLVYVSFSGGASDGKYYNTGTAIRVYGGGSCSISSNYTIKKIVYTFHDGETNANTGAMGYPNDKFPFNVDSGSFTMDATGAPVGTWTGSATLVKATRGSGSGHWRIQKMVVTIDE